MGNKYFKQINSCELSVVHSITSCAYGYFLRIIMKSIVLPIYKEEVSKSRYMNLCVYKSNTRSKINGEWNTHV